jgi:hypothetical protein
MVATLKVVDQHFGTGASERRAGVSLRLASERVTAREIIRSRVTAEVEALTQRTQAPSRSYIIDVEQGSPESLLNPSANNAKVPDVEAEVQRAITAFTKRRYIMLLDDRQIEDLDAGVGLRPESEVVFVYLKPLKGG